MSYYTVEWKPKWDRNGPKKVWKIEAESIEAIFKRMENVEPGCIVYRIWQEIWSRG